MRCRLPIVVVVLVLACLGTGGAEARRIRRPIDATAVPSDVEVASHADQAVEPVAAEVDTPAPSEAPFVPEAASALSVADQPYQSVASGLEVAPADGQASAADPVAVAVTGGDEPASAPEVTPTSSTISTAAVAPLVTYDVIIVGAGLAGLKAAADLRALNYNVVVLEGRDRIGGRVHSTKLTTTSKYPVELGAQWFHGSATDNPVHALVKNQLSITPTSSGNTGGLCTSTSGTQISDADYTDFTTIYDNFGTWVRAQETSTNATVSATFKNPSFSLASAVSAYVAEKQLSVYRQRGLAHLINTNIEQEFGASAAWLSNFLYNEGANINGGNFVMPVVSTSNPVPQNLSRVPLFLSSSLPAGALKLSHNVTNVAYNSTGVTVTATTAGTTVRFYAKAAIVAVPLGLLQRRGPSFFSPALDTAKQNAINRLGMSLLNKVILEFPSSYTSGPFAFGWWHNRLPDATGDTGYWQEFFVLRKAYGGSVPVVVAFQAGQPAVTAENTMTDDQMVLAQMRKWWPSLPTPTARFVTRWWNDPWTYGSYSYATTSCTGRYKGTPTERDAFQTPQSGRVWFAGEHTSIKYPATMQGAFLSGKAAATNVAATIPRG